MKAMYVRPAGRRDAQKHLPPRSNPRPVPPPPKTRGAKQAWQQALHHAAPAEPEPHGTPPSGRVPLM